MEVAGIPQPKLASITASLSSCVAAVVLREPLVKPVKVVEVVPVYSIISSSIFIYPELAKLAAESTVTLVAEAVTSLPSFTNVTVSSAAVAFPNTSRTSSPLE